MRIKEINVKKYAYRYGYIRNFHSKFAKIMLNHYMYNTSVHDYHIECNTEKVHYVYFKTVEEFAKTITENHLNYSEPTKEPDIQLSNT